MGSMTSDEKSDNIALGELSDDHCHILTMEQPQGVTEPERALVKSNFLLKDFNHRGTKNTESDQVDKLQNDTISTQQGDSIQQVELTVTTPTKSATQVSNPPKGEIKPTPNDPLPKPVVFKTEKSFKALFKHFWARLIFVLFRKVIKIMKRAGILKYRHRAAFLSRKGSLNPSQSDHLLQLSRVEYAIKLWKEAVQSTPNGHPEKAQRLAGLGMSYSLRFDQLGIVSDIESAIVAQKQAVELTPNGHSDKAARLSDLGIFYQCRFGYLGQLNDIESAIEANRQAVELRPNAAKLNSLGVSYDSRFHYLGQLSDIESAIEAKKQAVELTPYAHSDRAARLSNLGNSYQSRFRYWGNLGDIESAIEAMKQAVELTTDGHSKKASWLNNLGTCYRSRFRYLGQPRDIESAIEAHKRAVELTPVGHFNKASLLDNLGNSYQSRFHYLGNLSDIESAIKAVKQAVELTPDGHSSKADRLDNLGLCYSSRFGYLGELRDIETAVEANKQAVELTPDGHSAKAGRLSNLGISYESRFYYLQELSDIKSAIEAKQQAVKLTPDGHFDKAGRLNNLGNSYQSRFHYLGDLSDIESANKAMKQALELTPDGHSDKAGYLNNLGETYQSQFHYFPELSDIERAIKAKKQGLELTPDGHSEKAARLASLGISYKSRFGHLGQLSDIQSAIEVMEEAVELTPDGHAQKAARLRNLGIFYQSRFGHSHDQHDRDSALHAYQKASLQTSGRPQIQLHASILWSTLCSSPQLALAAYKRIFDLIPRVIWLGQTVSHRYQELPQIGSVINAAAAAAISVGDLHLAVEWLEEGRSIIWGQILQLRSPLDDLHNHYPEVAKQLKTIFCALESAGTLGPDNMDSLHESAEDEAKAHRAKALEYENILHKIRSFPGFGTFLKPKKFSELACAATHGPVVIVNVHSTRCDAIVLCISGDLILVPLPMFSLGQAQQLHLELLSSLQAQGVRVQRNGDQALRLGLAPPEVKIDNFPSVLAALWTNVVQPILSRINHVLQKPCVQDHLPHITWCATGPLTLLPLHAAGIYNGTRKANISDLVVSSYTTTLRALIDSASKLEQNQACHGICKVLIISQPNTPGYPHLPGTMEEAKAILKYTLADYNHHLTHDTATTEAVMHEMSKYDIIHFACHGIQDLQDPLDSAFALYDQRLTLKALMGVSLNNVQLAFLSACQTATGDQNLPEEAVHLAAGMLTVGYPSVIATLWSIGDKEAPIIVNKFYAKLMGHDVSGSNKAKMSPAYALHEAIKSLREEVGDINFVNWVPFIHFGV